MTQLKSEEIVGKTVTNAEGNVIGSVVELVVDTGTWRVTDLQLRVEKATAKEMGLKTPLFGALNILVETARIRSVADQVVLDLGIADFKGYVESRT